MSESFITPELIAEMQPGLLGIKPVITHGDSIDDFQNTELRKIVVDVLNAAKKSITAVAANPDAVVRPGSLEADFQVAFKEFASGIQKSATAEAQALLKSDPMGLKLIFGRYADVPVQNFLDSGFDRAIEDVGAPALDFEQLGFPTSKLDIPVDYMQRTAEGILIPKASITNFKNFESRMADATIAAANTGVFDQTKLAAALGIHSYDSDPFAITGPNEEFEAQAVTDKLRIKVLSVKCNDETNPEWPGNDEIALAGLSIDEDGDTKMIPERAVGDGFYDGRKKNLYWQYHTFGLRERSYWPKKFGVTFILAEKNNGGLSSFLQNLWVKVKDAVNKAIAAAAKAAGVAVSVFLGIPEVGGLIGSVLAAGVQWGVNLLAGFLINLFKDDIFRPQTAWTSIPSMSARWYYPNGSWGSTVSPVLSKRFKGFGGLYTLYYQWQLYA